jgi:hypothetical protein
LFTSVQALAAHSDAVVVFKASDVSRTVPGGGAPVTLVRARTTEALLGSVPPTFELRQMGTTTEIASDSLPLVKAGTTYVGFLIRETGVNDRPDQYWPAGATGLFELQGSPSDPATLARHLDPDSRLSAPVTALGELRRIVWEASPRQAD